MNHYYIILIFKAMVLLYLIVDFNYHYENYKWSNKINNLQTTSEFKYDFTIW